ncbi:beta-ketoacyl-[acyl-carrier-protein] synthase family protein [Thaumasiovibrio subtropicus]|uniref:beta-ketoacyl-[acyl-carrier-protein] synthase family protein n=1 Tax=Thaumasiovibrio subtropicus TaxID=1891207 RepID=UPI000B350E2A|nr:beta-ketoacyl-[acyl-carrier-protein] synthase family protein [Thaumasiovibrio subtropicus]
MSDPIYIHACSFISALGDTPELIHQSLISGDAPGFERDQSYLTDGTETWLGHAATSLLPLPTSNTRYQSRNNQLAYTTLQQIDDDIRATIKQFGAHRVAAIIGTSTSGSEEASQAVTQRLASQSLPEGYCYAQQELGNPAAFIADHYQIKGPKYVISTACSSSGRAFISAKRLLQADLVDAVLVGGVDTLCPLTLNGFHSLEALSNERCQPMGANRKGINIGEAAAFMILRKDKPSDEQAVCLWGVGESSDAHHISAPHPEGLGAISAMKMALEDANLQPSDIGYINAHGTATPLNDQMETKAIFNLFSNDTPVSSTKRLTGHTLGTASAAEAAICWHLLKFQLPLPAQTGLYPLDETLAPIAFTDNTTELSSPYILSNSFAFGGNNVSLIFGVEHG